MNRRFELRLGYGLSAFGDRHTSRPELGVGLRNDGRDYSLGCLAGGRGACEPVTMRRIVLSTGEIFMSDDYAKDTTTTGTVEVGGTATGVTETGNDFDWFRVEQVAGKTYIIDLGGLTAAAARWTARCCEGFTTTRVTASRTPRPTTAATGTMRA